MRLGDARRCADAGRARFGSDSSGRLRRLVCGLGNRGARNICRCCCLKLRGRRGAVGRVRLSRNCVPGRLPGRHLCLGTAASDGAVCLLIARGRLVAARGARLVSRRRHGRHDLGRRTDRYPNRGRLACGLDYRGARSICRCRCLRLRGRSDVVGRVRLSRGCVPGRLHGCRLRLRAAASDGAVCVPIARGRSVAARGARLVFRRRNGRHDLDRCSNGDSNFARDIDAGATSCGRLRRRLVRALRPIARCRGTLGCGDRRFSIGDLIVGYRLLRTPGQKREWIDIAVRVGGDSDPEVDARGSAIVRRRRDRANRLPLAHDSVFSDRDRAQPDERNGVAVRGSDRDRTPVPGHGAGERDRTGRGRAHVRARISGDIDAAVLPAGVGIVAEREGADHLTVGRPNPASRGSGQDHRNQCRREREHDRASHLEPPFFLRCQNR